VKILRQIMSLSPEQQLLVYQKLREELKEAKILQHWLIYIAVRTYVIEANQVLYILGLGLIVLLAQP
jgi:hypothetical protein